MPQALALAKHAYSLNEVPVGAVIVDARNVVIARQYNQVELSKNSLAHAEILAVNQACQILDSKYLIGCKIYVTLEPCYHCLAGLLLVKIDAIYFGAYDYKMGAIDSSRYCNSINPYHRAETYGGIYAEESEKLLRSFFKKLR